MVIGVVISIYYYFGWIREICFHPRPVFEDDEPRHDPWGGPEKIGFLKITLLSLALASIIFGVWQGPLGDAFWLFPIEIFYMFEIYSNARVAELVDAPELGSGVRMGVGVQVPPRAL